MVASLHMEECRSPVASRAATWSQLSFLTSVSGTRGLLVQNPDDDHPVDNWKCWRTSGVAATSS
jgi:hypothetical protein